MTTDFSTTKQRYSLQLYLTVLTIAVVLLGAIPTTLLHYERDSQNIYKHAENLLDISTERLATRFQERHQTISSSLRLLATSDVLLTQDWQQQVPHLDTWMRLISEQQSLSGLTIVYPNDEFIIIRDAKKWLGDRAGDQAFVVDKGKYNGNLTRHYFDAKMKWMGSSDEGITDFKGSSRPWYIDAVNAGADQLATSDPYQFFFYQMPGITIAIEDGETGVVIAADLTLEMLSGIFSDLELGESTVSLLVDHRDKILAINQKDVLTDHTGKPRETIPSIEQLPRGLLLYIRELLETEDLHTLEVKGVEWYGSNRRIELYKGISAQLILATPQRQLVAGAIDQRDKSLLLTLATLVVAMLFSWGAARYFSKPINLLAQEAQRLRDLDFDAEIKTNHRVEEISQLAQSMAEMQNTIRHFFSLINSLAGEPNTNALRERVLEEIIQACRVDGANLFFLNEEKTHLVPAEILLANHVKAKVELDPVPIDSDSALAARALSSGKTTTTTVRISEARSEQLQRILPLFEELDTDILQIITIPLVDRDQKGVGVLNLIRSIGEGTKNDMDPGQFAFAEALSGFAAVTLETHQLLEAQKELLHAFIKLIAGAIDSKSPYTGAHCERVPELAKLLAKAACEEQNGTFEHFNLDEKEWEALHIAAWLHDCGKVTTPEYVVDKATKLETIYNRLHEIRTRFELVKLQAHCDYWKALSEGGDEKTLTKQRDELLNTLDEEFAFVAKCNTGGEFMDESNIEKLKEIGSRRWQRTLDNTIGLSETEPQGKAHELPCWEPLLADKPEHIIDWIAPDHTADTDFTMKAPEVMYNLGEIYNLSIQRGTLTNEERFKINDHIIQTIIMLEKLPMPKHLQCVPEIAGGHHEKMDGTGYPRGLKKNDLSLQARMLAVADIFEALTASDRPYKKAKTLSASLKIMSFMAKDQHIDRDLFELFVSSGVYKEYAERYMNPEQIDEVDTEALLSVLEQVA